jgi:hypothetical protein
MIEESPGLLLSHAHSLPAVQVTEAALLEVLVHLGGDEAGKQLLGELVMLDLALTLLVMLKHPHRLEADRTSQQLVRNAAVRLAATVNLAMCGLCVITAEKSHGRQSSRPQPGLSTPATKAATRSPSRAKQLARNANWCRSNWLTGALFCGYLPMPGAAMGMPAE